MAKFHYEQTCALARAAEVIGERWTLLVIRDLLLGPRRFGELRAGLDGITASVLTERLRSLEDCGAVMRTGEGRRSLYSLTPSGEALAPALEALIRWGASRLLPLQAGDRLDPRWLYLALNACARESPTPTLQADITVMGDGDPIVLHVEGGPEGTRVDAGPRQAPLSFRARGETILGLMAGLAGSDRGLADGIEMERGSAEQLAQFHELFDSQLKPEP